MCEAGVQTICPVGTYQPAEGQATCIPTDPGYYSAEEGAVTQSLCEAGFYCSGGTDRIACRRGMLCEEGSSEELPCPAGYTCPTPSESVPCLSIAQYAPEGRSTPIDVSDGYYSLPLDASKPRTSQAKCEVRHDALVSLSGSLLKMICAAIAWGCCAISRTMTATHNTYACVLSHAEGILVHGWATHCM